MEVDVLKRCTFNTFDKVRAAIEGENIVGKKQQYTTKRTDCPFVVGVNYNKRSKEFVITKSYLKHNHDTCFTTTKVNTVAHKFDQSDLDFTEKLQLPNNKRIHGAEKNEENVECSKKTKFMQELDQNNKISHLPSTNDTKVDLCDPQNATLQIHDPKDDGYDVNRLDEVFSYMESGNALQKYWFYSPECAQLASDSFNVPVIVLAAENYSFMPLNQEPDFCKKPIILKWHDLSKNGSCQNPVIID
ncbi:41021_t:CDS:2 [Gigaspora margarita]|uniref:41021_t:CDS:1 n=1 Tax=Gigaspora margarita TaxID=4874 RepID=A0ABN7W283_GIGMA|nr:41021_t:CDS:2 [Gigaspora margarita]